MSPAYSAAPEACQTASLALAVVMRVVMQGLLECRSSRSTIPAAGPRQHRGNPSTTLSGCRGTACTDATRSSRRSTGALDAVARGGRRLLIVRGEAGIGKTRLLAELRERAAAQRFVVLEGRATELEHDVPLVPVVDALEPHLPDADALAALGAERLDLLAEVFPRWVCPWRRAARSPSAGACTGRSASCWR